jgi:hypothetical protein
VLFHFNLFKDWLVWAMLTIFLVLLTESNIGAEKGGDSEGAEKGGKAKGGRGQGIMIDYASSYLW